MSEHASLRESQSSPHSSAFCVLAPVESCCAHSCALALLDKRHSCTPEHHCGLTIRTGSSLRLATQAFTCPSLRDPLRKECRRVGTWSAEILEDDDGPHPAPRTWKGESEVSWWWEASPVRCRTGALGRKDPQFADERAEPREVTGLPGLRRAPPLVAKDSGTQTENTLPWGLLRVTGSFRTHAQQPRAALDAPGEQRAEGLQWRVHSLQMKFNVDSSQRIPRARWPVSAGGGGARTAVRDRLQSQALKALGASLGPFPARRWAGACPGHRSLAKPRQNRTADCHPPDLRGGRAPLTSPGCQADLTEPDGWSSRKGAEPPRSGRVQLVSQLSGLLSKEEGTPSRLTERGTEAGWTHVSTGCAKPLSSVQVSSGPPPSLVTLAFPVSPRAALQATGSWAVPPLTGPQGLLTGCSHTSASAQEDPGFLLPRDFSSHVPPNTLDCPRVPTQDWRITAWCSELFPGPKARSDGCKSRQACAWFDSLQRGIGLPVSGTRVSFSVSSIYKCASKFSEIRLRIYGLGRWTMP
uniref:Uncharacterized protein n=1 Tax=Rangifer tarandus platyrhynchus TaxID=3082113 RepID=A0ACB0DZM3_RANTA|nr:unnamed protein product [Rangifer tarandus platyrhynchus]